jgi:hypothetical protein
MGEWSSKKCALTWKVKGTKYNRYFCQLVPLAHRTEETEFGLLPTPNASEGEKGAKTYNLNSQMGRGLSAMAGSGLLPTPTVFDSTNASATMKSSQVKEGSMHSMTLPRMLSMGLLSTPTVSDSKGAYPPTSLDNFPTRRVSMKSIYCQMEEGEKNYHSKDSQLNPRFVAEMMGFPPNWTELPFQSGDKNQ